jgi:hypothetical protein
MGFAKVTEGGRPKVDGPLNIGAALRSDRPSPMAFTNELRRIAPPAPHAWNIRQIHENPRQSTDHDQRGPICRLFRRSAALDRAGRARA